MTRSQKIKQLFLKHYVGDLVFVDVGARGKLECIEALRKNTELHAFEPDPEAFEALKKNYKESHFKKLHLQQTALSDHKGFDALFISQHASMSSLLESDLHNYQKHFGEYKEFPTWKKRMNLAKKIDVKTDMLDNYFGDIKGTIDFLKIDTQGTELSILKGAQKLLEQNKISIIKLEVTTIPVYKNQALFSEIDIFLRNLNYTLVDFITYRETYSAAFEKKIVPKHFGPCGDAIYVLNDENELKKVGFKKSLILFWLGYQSLALNILISHTFDSDDQKALSNFFQPGLKGRSKIFVKNLIPPFLWHIARKIITRFSR